MIILYDQLSFLYACLSESRYYILDKMASTVMKTLGGQKVLKLKEQG